MQLRTNYDAMADFCRNFLSCVVGKVEWKNNCCDKRISELASPSDEAFALLILENVWMPVMHGQPGQDDEDGGDHAGDVAEDPSATSVDSTTRKEKPDHQQKSKKRKVMGVYTEKNVQRPKKFGGWSAKGLERMIHLKLMVEEDRKLHPEFEVEFLEEEQMARNKKKGNKGKLTDFNEYEGLNVDEMEDFEKWPI